MDEQIDRLVEEVQKSAKYAAINPALVARIAAAELEKGRKFKEAVKHTKSKLHQVGGAYLSTPPNYPAWLASLKAAEDPETFKKACQWVMSHHASTRERLPFLEEAYTQIFAALPKIESVLDVASGLNPMAVPWMPMDAGVRYHACDIYSDMVDFLNEFFALAWVPVDGQAALCDVVAAPPDQPADLGLVLKAIPCLEQVDKQAGTRLLDNLNVRYLVISYPAKSLGGRRKGMLDTYTASFEALIDGRGWQVLERLEFETELFFVVRYQD
ncbi:MAG: hypothetical protein P8046_11490 [Anaerolineales bacterium]